MILGRVDIFKSEGFRCIKKVNLTDFHHIVLHLTNFSTPVFLITIISIFPKERLK